jgi:hypothetical protein
VVVVREVRPVAVRGLAWAHREGECSVAGTEVTAAKPQDAAEDGLKVPRF